MNPRVLQEAVSLGQKLRHIFVATSDRSGLPHVAAASQLALSPEGRVEVGAWFCPGTVANLQENKRISVVIWNPKKDLGFQLLGETEKVEELAIMDGYAPEEEKGPPLPQIKRQLTVRVDKVSAGARAAIEAAGGTVEA